MKCSNCNGRCGASSKTAAVDPNTILCEKCNTDIPEGAIGDNAVPLVEDVVLAYMCRVYHECSQEQLKRTIKNYYDPTEISQAKKCLWDVYGEDVMGPINNRRGSVYKTVTDFELEDLINGLQKLDQKMLWNTKARFCTCDVFQSPLHKPEEENLTSFVDRLVKLEERMNSVQQDVMLHTTQIGGVTTDVQRAMSYKAMASAGVSVPLVNVVKQRESKQYISDFPSLSCAMTGNISTKKDNQNDPHNSATKSVLVRLDGDAKTSGGEGMLTVIEQPMIDGTKKKPSFVEPSTGQSAFTVDMVSQAISSLPEDFQLPSAHKKKLRVMGKKKNNESSVKGAPKVKTLAVTNITSDTEDDQVEKLVKEIGHIESFRKAYNLDKMKTKQFT